MEGCMRCGKDLGGDFANVHVVYVEDMGADTAMGGWDAWLCGDCLEELTDFLSGEERDD